MNGVYPSIPNADYHAGPGLSSSDVKLLLRSPAHYRHTKAAGSKITADLLFGQLVHDLVGMPDRWDHLWHVVDASTRNTNRYKDAVKDHPGKTCVLTAEFEAAAEVAVAVRQSHQVADCRLTDGTELGDILAGALLEHSIYWQQQDVLCKARPDIWLRDRNVVVDLKTTRCAEPDAFLRDAIRYGYHTSAAWYCRAVQSVTGEPVRAWLWLVVEKEAPYAVQVYQADPGLLAIGDHNCSRGLDRFKACSEADSWPAYASTTLTLAPPAWLGIGFDSD